MALEVTQDSDSMTEMEKNSSYQPKPARKLQLAVWYEKYIQIAASFNENCMEMYI
jgi:hypothetical protein